MGIAALHPSYKISSDSVCKQPDRELSSPPLPPRSGGEGRSQPAHRHCERSEAIHRAAQRKMDCFVASLLAMMAERANSSPSPTRSCALRGPRRAKLALEVGGGGLSASPMHIESAEAPPTPSRRALCARREGEEHDSAFSRHDAPELCQESSPQNKRGRRECRVLNAPIASCVKIKNTRA
jgi:hypothetical protein